MASSWSAIRLAWSRKLRRFTAESGFVQTDVIIPRVHILRNEWRIHRQSQNLLPMVREEPAQPRSFAHGHEFIPKREVDQNRVSTFALKLGLHQLGTRPAILDE